MAKDSVIGSGPAGQSYGDIVENWKKFQTDMQDKLTHAMEEQRSLYTNFNSRWGNASKNVNEQLSEISKKNSTDYKELYTVWKNYQNKINARVLKANNMGNNGYSELMDKWNDQATKMMGLISRLRDAKGEDAEGMRMDLYTQWLDLANSMNTNIANAVQVGNVEFQNLTRTWFEFMDHMRATVSKVPDTSPAYKETMKTMENISTNMGMELSNLVSGNLSHLKKMQQSWQQASEKLRADMSKVFTEVNYEELYTGFIDRTSAPWTAMVSTPKVKSLEDEVEVLKQRVKELEGRLKEKK